MVNRLTIRGPRGKPPKTVHFQDPMSTLNSADEYVRQKQQSSSSPAAASDAEQTTTKTKKRKMSTASPPPSTDEEGDTIAVQQKMKTVEIEDVPDDDSDDDSPLSDLEQLEKQVDEGRKRSATSGANRPWARNGKAPVREHGQNDGADDDYDMVEAAEADEEEIDEGSVDYNDQGEDAADGEGDPNRDEVISISSQDDEKEDAPFDLLDRPWRVEGFNRGMRQHWETMYCTVEMQPLGNSWNNTEDYQREKDKEMLRYMEDFALPTWVIPREQAEQAYFRLLERSRWRTLGIRIYGNQRIPEIIPNATPFNRVGQMPHQQMPLNILPGQYQHHRQQGQYQPQRQPSMSGSRPPSVAQQQQMQYRPPPHQQGMPPNGMPPNGMPPNGMPPNGMLPQGMHPNMMPPPPNQMLRSQPHAMPMNVPPGGHQQHQQAMQIMQQQHMMQGHPHMSHAPHGLPYAVGPHMMSHANVPMHAPRPMQYGMPPGMPPGMQQMPGPGHVSKPVRRKKETPLPPTPPPPPPTPPYNVRQRPIPRKEFNKTGKRNMRKQAEALDFPWQRKLDFYKARDEAKWDDSGYDRDILDGMTAVRQKNMPIITKLDDELAEKQRMRRVAEALARKQGRIDDMLTGVTGNQRNKKKRGPKVQAQDEQSSDMEKGQSQQPEDGEKKETKRKSENIGGDPYYSGNFSFASEEDRQKALALQRKTPDDIIDAAEAGGIDWELCKQIFICWNPGKKGLTQDLVQAQYRIYDTLITRKQLESTPILTRRAAECIVDFCPDMLWRETLLRIVSEAGYGNKDVRDRFCYNGCHNDKATITKRIAAALGQKQQNPPKGKRKAQLEAAEAANSASADEDGQPPKKKGRRGPLAREKKDRYQEGEEEWHAANKVDFNNYIRFFGKRPGQRVYPTAGDKRKKSEDADGSGAGGSEMDTGSPSKRAKSEVEDGPSPATSDGTEMEVDNNNAAEESEEEDESEVEEGDGDEEQEEEEQDDDVDAVSIQGSSVFSDD
ncbi:hypothetical protein LTR85_006416 [Meristemomyces frigidus]|nr:hypothetical protein LTR85_006416 [Meristemomyces frigidus]